MNLKPLALNMTEITIGNKRVLFSYQTPVAYINDSYQAFKTEKFWSKTTSRHINKWLNGKPAFEMEQKEFDSLFDEVK